MGIRATSKCTHHVLVQSKTSSNFVARGERTLDVLCWVQRAFGIACVPSTELRGKVSQR